MKKIILAAMFIGVFQVAFAQEESNKEEKAQLITEELEQTGNHEIKFNLGMAVVGIPELSYEYFIEDNMGVGLSAAVALLSEDDLTLRSIFTPYYRLYFGRKKAAGFFIEGNAAIASYKDEYYEYYYSNSVSYEAYREDKYTSFGFGLAVGFKLLARNGFSGEIYAGGGRLFNDESISAFPRLGVSLGKRF